MEIDALLKQAGFPTTNVKFLEVAYKVARLIERHHGITMDERTRPTKQAGR
jgi:hypothetical protein